MNRILLIEGSQETALQISKLLQHNLEIELLHARSSQDALEMCVSQSLDLVLVDVSFPHIDGFEVCGLMHEREETRHIPVLLLTLMESDLYPAVKALSMGPGEIYTLPTPASNFVAWVKIILKLVANLKPITGSIPLAPTADEVSLPAELLNRIDHAIAWIDRKSGKILLVNAPVEKLTGYPPEMVQGKTLADIISQDAQGELEKLFQQANDQGESSSSALKFVRRSGMPVQLEISLKKERICNAEGIVAQLRSVSETAAEAEPCNQEELSVIAEFVAALAHEARNPLTGISTNIQYMQMTYDDTETQREIYTEVIEAVHRLDQILRQSVEFLRPMPLRLLKTDLTQIVQDAVNTAQEKDYPDRHFEYSIGSNGRIPAIEIDPERFPRALQGLLCHCAREAGEKGEVKIDLKADRKQVQISVAHSGQGLSPQKHQQLFEPVAALKSADLGLGLAHVKRILDEHRFILSAQSEYEQGVRFDITIPLVIK